MARNKVSNSLIITYSKQSAKLQIILVYTKYSLAETQLLSFFCFYLPLFASIPHFSLQHKRKRSCVTGRPNCYFIHRMTRNLFGGFLLQRLLTDWRRGDLFGRYRYPLRMENIPRRKICVICEICGTKKLPRRKICVICEICVTQNNKGILRPAIGQRPNIRENP